jgi:hypothetical protein
VGAIARGVERLWPRRPARVAVAGGHSAGNSCIATAPRRLHHTMLQ